MLRFQSTFPRRERQHLTISMTRSWEFQSTFPRRERPEEIASARASKAVSIHVPAKGTTGFLQQYGIDLQVSIHVPAKGTTRFSRTGISHNAGFNPRSREGNDAEMERLTQWIDVSIHVPAKGTTKPLTLTRDSRKFQSTFPRRERLESVDELVSGMGFNPRSREGNDTKSVHSRAWHL